MKKNVLILGIVGLITSSTYGLPDISKRFNSVKLTDPSATSAQYSSQSTNMDDVSYAIGYKIGSNFHDQKINLNVAKFINGLNEATANEEDNNKIEKMHQVLMEYQRQVYKDRVEQLRVETEKNKIEGEKFLAENKTKKNVVTLPSGLQYKIITEGNGTRPSTADLVKVNYTAKLLNGKEFASNNDPNNPSLFSLTQILPGLKEAIQLMKKNAEWEIYVPSNLAYGLRGYQDTIQPNSTLIFKVHVIDFEKLNDAKSENARPGLISENEDPDENEAQDDEEDQTEDQDQ